MGVGKENGHGLPKTPHTRGGSHQQEQKLLSSSKVLRDAYESAGKRRLLTKTGAVRLLEPRLLTDRIGIDGSSKTPSKELLKSTHASRQQRHNDKKSPDYEELDRARETTCTNPVARSLHSLAHEDNTHHNNTSPAMPVGTIVRNDQIARPRARRPFAP